MVTSKVTRVVRINDNSAQGPSSAANLISAVLIANADASSIGILSDQRESKGLLLIANLELEFRISPIRISKLKFSNRKFLTISSSLFRAAHLKPQVMEFLIENARLRFGLTHTKISSLQISNRERIAISQPAQSPTSLSLVVTRHLPLTTAVLIVTPRLEFPVITTKQKLNRISNRYKTRFLQPECNCRNPFVRGLTAFPSFTDHESPATSHAAQSQISPVTRHSTHVTAFLAYHIDLPSTYGLAWRAHRRSAWSPEACREFAESCSV